MPLSTPRAFYVQEKTTSGIPNAQQVVQSPQFDDQEPDDNEEDEDLTEWLDCEPEIMIHQTEDTRL